MKVSGKLVIIAILALALVAAGSSWWFRYNATHRAAAFWGPEASRLIRDAKVVELYQFEPSSQTETEFEELRRFLDAPSNARNVSSMRGLTHLRNALLEDRNYDWPPQQPKPNDQWRGILVFWDEPRQSTAVLAFSPEWQFVTNCKSLTGGKLSCAPIAAGLREMFTEMMAEPTAQSRRPANEAPSER
jgi:hypothetical protein